MIIPPTTSDEQKQPQEGMQDFADPLALEIDDDKLVKYIDQRVEQAKKFYKDEKDLYNRQKKNEDYLFGRQIDTKSLKPYNARYIDNVIYEAEATIKPIALSRLPDLYVTPGNTNGVYNADIERESKKITDFINSEIRRREYRRVLGIAHKHIPVGFLGAIKYRWNPAKGKYGNYEFYVVHYSRLVLDHNSKTNDPNDMDFVRELVTMSIKELLSRFPDKKDTLIKKIGLTEQDLTDESKLATPIDISEIWFKWHEDTSEGHQVISGVMWKYQNILLKKMKNPNWDWQGETITFKYDEEQAQNSGELSLDELKQAAVMQYMSDTMQMGPMQSETVYHNYFEQPEFPYIFLGYDQFGTMPYDETSRIEQNLYKQDNINKRGRQITEIIDRAKGRHIFSSSSGLAKEDIEELDMDDPDVDVLVDGPVNDVHALIPAELPGPALFQDQDINRQRVFQSMGTNSTTRGQKETDVATTAQILRESDFGRIDDLVEDTINYASERMARAILQLIKLRYTEAHFVNIMGSDGSVIYDRLHRDMIKDGMEVIVHASGVDKMLRKKEAYEQAGMKLIDPLTFFEKTDEPNPVEKTKRLMYFMTDPNTYMAKYIMSLDNTTDMVNALNGQQPPQPGQPPGQPPVDGSQQQTPPMGQDTGAQEATMAIAQLQQGQMPQPPQQVTPGYIDTINAFIQSPQFQQLPDNIKQLTIQFAQSLTQHPQVQQAGAAMSPTQEATATPAGPGIGGVMGEAMNRGLVKGFINAGL